MKTGLVLALAAALGLSSPARAQDGGSDEEEARKIVQQIQEDLDGLVEDLAKLASGDRAKGERVVDNIDKLLEDLGGSGDRVVENIDELLRKMKKQQSPSSSGGGGQPKSSSSSKQQRPSQRRDRNQKGEDGERDRRSGKREDRPDGNGEPRGGEDERTPKQGETPRKPPESGEERVPFLDDSEVWGTLPPEVKQILIESSYRDYFPEYEREISEYMKSLNRRR